MHQIFILPTDFQLQSNVDEWGLFSVFVCVHGLMHVCLCKYIQVVFTDMPV